MDVKPGRAYQIYHSPNIEEKEIIIGNYELIEYGAKFSNLVTKMVYEHNEDEHNEVFLYAEDIGSVNEYMDYLKTKDAQRGMQIYFIRTILSACVVAPRFDHLEGGQRVDQPGVSFVLPKGKPWYSIFRSTYQASFGRLDEPRKETFVVQVSVYDVPSPSKQFIPNVS